MMTEKTITRKLMMLIGLVGLIGLMSLCPLSSSAQIMIGGNVYGGGNKGNVGGSTNVRVRAGDLNKVFGGARMANVGGNSYVNIDGRNALAYMVINYVFGGNDITGNIGTAATVNESLPAELTSNTDGVDDTWNSYVHLSTNIVTEDIKYTAEEAAAYNTAHSLNPDDDGYKTTDDVKIKAGELADNQKIFIGQLFAGGNGDYYYEQVPGPEEGQVTHNIYLKEGDATPIATKVTAVGEGGFNRPELAKTYLDIQGGTIFFSHGGGNNATVTEKAVIHVDNPSDVVTQIYVDEDGLEIEKSPTADSLLTDDRIKHDMGIRMAQEHVESSDFQMGRLFGGNNKAAMAIRPTWNLQAGRIRNLYSGGNRGMMTSSEGLLLEINPLTTNKYPLVIDNVYGGCRMADVMPLDDEGKYAPCTNLPGYSFPNELAARVLVRGGDVNNVYGGNDITGKVWGGNAIGIYTSIRGDVYGGGNGAYAYTDMDSYKDNEDYGDFYYSQEGYTTSIDALNAFRPNAEQVSIRLAGTSADKPTIIKGSVFCGGNCATLKTTKENAMVELKIGSHVIADKVFLGNNGEKMVDEDILKHYAGVYPGAEYYSTLNGMKDDPSVFAGYMEGAAMDLHPSIVFDKKGNGDPVDYVPYSSYIGSFYCGGNKGSMTASGKTSFKFDQGLVVFEKLVGGCNDADVEEGTYNAAYQGGILGSSDEQISYTEGSKIKDRIELNLENVVIEPKRWNEAQTGLEWNTALWSVDEDDFVKTGIGGTDDGTGITNDKNRRLLGGNVYGGCYNSGHVNGNVVINISQDLIKRDVVFANPASDDPYTISGARRSGVLKEAQGDDVMAVSMSVFGAGKGEDTEVWGSTAVNLNNGYAFQLFGGGEEGVVGKKNDQGEYVYNAAYSSTVNLKGANAGYSEKETGLPLAETEYIYGGGSEGDVLGDTYVYLGNGRVYDAFGGASNADVYGGTEVHVGYNGGFPWIRDNVYGGNDFGGTVRGKRNHTTAISKTAFDAQMLQSSTYVKYLQGRVDSIFGGCYGSYPYADPMFKDYTYSTGEANIPDGLGPGAPRLDNETNKPVFSFPHLDYNSFVHFTPEENGNNKVGYIFGGSEGFPNHSKLNNGMQKECYVHVDDTKTKDANRFANVDIYGGGAFAGTGLEGSLGAGRTAVDLYGGSFHNVYGGCNQEGLVGYTRVNVPSGSTAKVNAIFGGGKGYSSDKITETPALAARYCDHYVTCVDYESADAIVNDAIYGGNENSRIACDTYINIGAPVMQSSGYQASIYGAGYGKNTVSGRTNVFMNNNSNAYKVFGGGRDGNAFNFVSLRQWLGKQYLAAGVPLGEIADSIVAYRGILEDFGEYLAANPIHLPTNIGTYVNDEGEYDGTYTNDILPTEQKPNTYHQTNVHIMDGGNVSGYAYGGGYGKDAVVAGTTYIELKGGNVDRDIYGGGEGGPVFDEFGLKNFTATTNVYIKGGMARNVYGGGYLGSVGKHCKTVNNEIVEAGIHETGEDVVDIPAVANVTIGRVGGIGFYDGIPAITRNVYGGGEGGSVYGKANLTINNGYIGYRYKNTATSGAPVYKYVEELDDNTPNAIELAGNAFGGGYVINSFVDSTHVTMYGGTVRGSLYGGGELGPIGRGTMKSGATGGFTNGNAHIYQGGTTYVKLFDGHVLRNVFGGGRGKDSWGGDGTKYMDADLVATLDLKSKGFVFGKTEVDIYGGEVGTSEGVAQGYGNVFGAGDVGCVYSATGTKSGNRYDNSKEGYYYGNGGSGELTEDCKVLVEPWCKATSDVTINETSYAEGTYVPTSALNYLGNKTASEAEWTALGKIDVNKEGVIIHNAVFAGGNTSPGSTEVFANTPTVFGNATASIHDVYNRDLISIGRGRVGGLYGDGNLTLVDGYRELNITNYGTDFYHINPEITLAEYNNLTTREAAYYEIRYKCLTSCTDKDGKTYAVGATITADEMLTVFEGVTVGEPAVPMIDADGKPLAAYWEENGVCSRYAGRPMNTVQRADFCGVFGSRMVMQGAQDRVPEVVDYTNYTINRVREVSLNKKTSVRAADASDDNKNKEHGNYFGIYSVVNYLGALTSDVDFHNAVRVTDNTDTGTYQAQAKGKSYGEATYYDWKDQFHEDRRRNNGISHNKVALASGVYLELTSEKSTGKGLYEKDWGYITGVVELDLINVQPGMGGGYVYAKNEHGVRSASGKTNTILTSLNTGAVTNKIFTYSTDDSSKKEWETSGNFVHNTKTIIDDCYNIGNKYKAPDAVPAHYWYIKGAVYVYDQYISAYTGSPNAFSEEVSIPLTITSASHGKLTLMDVMPNRYAYYSNGATKDKLGADQKITIRDKEYGLNDAITYWDYSQLTATEKAMFVEKTYTVISDCTYGDGATPVTYKAGTVVSKEEYENLRTYAPKKYLEEGDEVQTPYVHLVTRDEDVDFDYAFRPSNNVSHDTGYILTYNINNPNQWNTWYTPKSGSSLAGKNQTGGADYEDGPTYTPNTTGMFGQNDYKVASIISKEDYDTYQAAKTTYPTAIPSDQATFKPAYIVTAEVLETKNKDNTDQRLHKGATLAKEDYTDAQWSSISGSIDEAFVATRTIQLSNTEVIYRNTYLSEADVTTLKSTYSTLVEEINKVVQPAYYCTTAGKYGGNYYQTGNNYRALAAFSAMTPEDRKKFDYNYDALDLLIDPNYSRSEGVKYQYDGKDYDTADDAEQNKATYSLPTSIDYSATYKGSTSFTYIDDNNEVQTIKTDGTSVLTRSEFERLPNEQYYWAPITVSAAGTYYVVKETIILGDTPYAAGQVISSDTYSGLSDTDKANVESLTFDESGTYYYCREGYTINSGDYTGSSLTGKVTDINGTTHTSTVSAGTVINAETDGSSYGYDNVINKQANFSIHGLAPTETSTLYVTRGSDIFDLSAEKIITVIYQYDYVESDMLGQHITPVSERHILNIHLNFKSGVPTVEDIRQPDIILPGTALSMPEPYVTPGAYEITGGGWKLFESETDAESHINGVEYTNSVDPLYLYQNKYWLAYYTRTYLGETYSNHVPVSVANYHDLKKVMDAKTHHYYIDHKDVHERLGVKPKIYINDYSGSSENGLDLFKNLYDLSIGETLTGHNPLNERIKAGENLEFFLRTDINHPESWTSIASEANQCFEGTLHGDGHTISGLNNSLFGHLCGNVYNLGVTGSFTGAGVADEGKGYVESCWINTTGTPASGVRAVFGNPTATNDIKQIVNSYYQAGKSYSTTDTGSHGLARAMSDQAFYNGTVAYDLNNFYLYKRYNDGTGTSSGVEYKYWIPGEEEPQTGHYANNIELCSSGYNNIKYVEERFKDGDFRYAGGTIPNSEDERFYTKTLNPGTEQETVESGFYPIWPDDYIFFGQKLTYGWAVEAHQNVPTAVVRDGGRLSTNSDANRVYRAPAYYGSSTMSMAHFNQSAYLAQKSSDGTKEAYPGMTAIDFAGHNGANEVDGTYALGMNDGKFYAPLLDDGGLQSITNCDETKNLLAYAPAETSKTGYANKTTYGVLTDYFVDPAYSTYYDKDESYRTVADATSATSSVYGHLVKATLTNGLLTATSDHLLVDKQDFNCPIAYGFDGTHRMWYQRKPEDQEYVDHTKGWQGISIPFTAELVTTNDKGEITHFYEGSATSANSDKKIGHEYWLREFNSIAEEGTAPSIVARGSFLYPSNSIGSKNYTNTYLWDYYYKNADVHNQKDKNSDFYQTYYNSSHNYSGYPLLAAAKPYIIGFPGQTYYEFDLSGNFEARNTAVAIDKLGKQTITFASNTGISIGVSDGEMGGKKVTCNNHDYYFKPNYMNTNLETGTNSYTLNSEGSSFVKVTGDAVKVSAFRPYFMATAGTSGSRRMLPGTILLGGDYSGLEGEPISTLDGDLEIYVKDHQIVTTSHLKDATTVRIISVSGVTMANYVLQPGETKETPIRVEGVYIVNKKKLFVK